ncbi:molecular chaperone [Xenococcus sp. PCC 7305]|uniref:Hsp70 family protein n=1 Tax=Xenococcus sp. PCC 7305 TaxID=102125 RepID=UPI0002AC4B82|nr:Hsp70 family protein [Xenococcus sp. PCC 7305]ELS03693.1 molecular chaperone [Xenococcus sp. PCC 7305]
MADNLNSTNSYAIDFGTSNTVITRWNGVTKTAETITFPNFSQKIPNSPPVIPSLVYVKDARLQKVLIGQQVRDRGLDLATDNRFFRSFKRGIGADIQGFLPRLDETEITFEQIGEWFLRELIQNSQTDAGGNLDSLVVTVPVDSFDTYRLWLTDICQSLEIGQLRILDEPTAAALGYGAADQELLLVVDFGGGTLDISLIQLSENTSSNQGFILKWGQKILGENTAQKKQTAKVIAKAGQNLGGSDIDNWLVDYFATNQGLDKSAVTTRLAERLKIKLSEQESATEVYFNDETLESYALELDRQGFEAILEQQGFFTKLDELMAQVLQRARRNGIEVEEINQVLLVGGTVQIPAVQTWVAKYFEPSKIRCDRPLTAIAEGALQVAQGIEVKDFLYHSYGIRYWNRRDKRHNWHSIIKSGQPYPMAQPVRLVLGASVENQPSIELILGELATESVGREVYFDGDRLVTRSLGEQTTNVKPLNDQEGASTIAILDPPGNPGRDRIELLFSVDEQSCLRVTVQDLLTQETLLDNQIVGQLK